MGGLATVITTILFTILNIFIYNEWEASLINSVQDSQQNNQLSSNEILKQLKLRVSYRGIYKLHDYVMTLNKNLEE